MSKISGEFRGKIGFLAAALVGVGTSSPVFLVYATGVFVGPLAGAFGWTRQQILGALTAATVGTLLASVFAGVLADRFSNWKLIAASQTALGLGCFALAAGTSQLWRYYGLYLVVAIASAGGLSITIARMISLRFAKNRGFAIGVATAGSGVCGLLLPPYAAWAIEHFGWRGGYIAVGLIPLCVAVPATVSFMRDAKSRLSSSVMHVDSTPPLVGLAFQSALRHVRFWLMVIAFFLVNGTAVGTITNLVPHLVDRGYDLQTAARIVSIFGLSSIFGRVAMGTLMDRIWVPILAFLVLLTAAIVTVMLAFIGQNHAGVVAIVVVLGIATGAEVDFLSYLVPKYFGYRDFGKIYACIFVLFNLGAGIGPMLFGRVFDLRRSYELAFLLGGFAWAVGGILLLCLGRYPDWGER